LKFPNIKIDLTPQKKRQNKTENSDRNENITEEDSNLKQKEEPLPKFEKLLIESIIKKYDVIILDRKIIIENLEKKYEFLSQNKIFLKEIKKSLLKSKNFIGIKLSFLNSTENERNFHFQKFVFFIQKEIKNFIRDHSKKNHLAFVFLKISNKIKSPILESDSSPKVNENVQNDEKGNQQIIDDIMKNIKFSPQETPLIKKLLYKIPPFLMKNYFEVIASVENYIDEKQSII